MFTYIASVYRLVKIVAFIIPLDRKHFNEKAKEAMEEMVRDIRDQFNTILNTIDWMDDKTRKRAKVTFFYSTQCRGFGAFWPSPDPGL
jgi:predicted metalloendopeptidase